MACTQAVPGAPLARNRVLIGHFIPIRHLQYQHTSIPAFGILGYFALLSPTIKALGLVLLLAHLLRLAHFGLGFDGRLQITCAP